MARRLRGTRSRELLDLLQIDAPIFQAPMAGVSTPGDGRSGFERRRARSRSVSARRMPRARGR